jgi:hypothetical protein
MSSSALLRLEALRKSKQILCLESRMHGNGAPRDAVLNPWHSQEELGGRFLDHRAHLKAKAGGDNSMLEKRRGSPKTPRALLREARLIGRKLHCLNPNPQRGNDAPPPLRRLQRGATGSRPFGFRGLLPPSGQAMASEAIEGDEWGAYVRLETFSITGTRDRLTGASPKATGSP